MIKGRLGRIDWYISKGYDSHTLKPVKDYSFPEVLKTPYYIQALCFIHGYLVSIAYDFKKTHIQ